MVEPNNANGTPRRRSSSLKPMSKFPDLLSADSAIMESEEESYSRSTSPAPLPNGLSRLHSSKRWPMRPGLTRQGSSFKSWITWAGGSRKKQQKSLGEAIKTVRARKASVSESAHEIAESLKAPVSLRLVVGLFFLTMISQFHHTPFSPNC